MNGDYDDVKGRLRSEALIKRFMIKFLSDPSGKLLFDSMESGSYDDAFRAAHTLKGVSQNLGFTMLYKSSSAITEALRAKDYAAAKELLAGLRKDFALTVSVIEAFQAENGN